MGPEVRFALPSSGMSLIALLPPSVRAMIVRSTDSSQPNNIGDDWIPAKEGEDQSVGDKASSSEQRSLVNGSRASRSSLPFIPTHDIPRGIAYAFQALLGYTLMLAVMWVVHMLRVQLRKCG